MNFDLINLDEIAVGESAGREETGSSLFRRMASWLMLVLAGYCFWQGAGLLVWEDSSQMIAAVASPDESSVVPDAVPITQLDVGDWVFAASNPNRSEEQ